MSSEEVACVICGRPGVLTWTIDGAAGAGVVDLCVVHSKPLTDALAAAAAKPRNEEASGQKTPELPRRVARRASFEPLDWAPPAGS
ncbi:hypothetical protein [Arthrobacter sunyaminii]|uniref:hypothetical protein n=1 Tax=Arthrobacter sunyaminii TaxID=2816859 RepID=UPI001A953E3C|nr:hypothetical protein [Arthrobacter sunyaminii]MBO0896137.1 hypothetical protein [Arthrobacter sunyaminii]